MWKDKKFRVYNVKLYIYHHTIFTTEDFPMGGSNHVRCHGINMHVCWWGPIHRIFTSSVLGIVQSVEKTKKFWLWAGVQIHCEFFNDLHAWVYLNGCHLLFEFVPGSIATSCNECIHLAASSGLLAPNWKNNRDINKTWKEEWMFLMIRIYSCVPWDNRCDLKYCKGWKWKILFYSSSLFHCH